MMNLNSITNAYTFRYPSPDGIVIVHCTEDANGKLAHIIINIGKAGLPIASWADALSRMMTELLRYTDVNTLLEHLSNIKTDRSVFHNNQNIYSAPDAIYRALALYKSLKNPPVAQDDFSRIVIPANW